MAANGQSCYQSYLAWSEGYQLRDVGQLSQWLCHDISTRNIQILVQLLLLLILLHFAWGSAEAKFLLVMHVCVCICPVCLFALATCPHYSMDRDVTWLGVFSTLCLKKGYHPTTNDNFNNSCPISVIIGTYTAE